MDRRDFFQKGALTAFGLSVLGPAGAVDTPSVQQELRRRRKARNIIFLVSDGMSGGTLQMADLLSQRLGRGHSQWIQLYLDNRVSRALMDMSSLDSAVTDSAAASSSWGGGVRVNNGALNIGPKGELHQPILQKFKAAGKAVGCVTTVPITHATPAGFCANSKSRNSMEGIALQYLNLRFDVMMGGGTEVFHKDRREDKRDLFQAFASAGFQVVQSRDKLAGLQPGAPILGVFHESGLPYAVDHERDEALKAKVPTLAEMTATAIRMMEGQRDGFVLQVEGGKVDWAAHGNDVAGLLYDQLAFDDAVKVAIDFAARDKHTLVVVTTDHGNANPALLKGSKADVNFDKVQQFKQSNEWVLRQLSEKSSVEDIISQVQKAQGILLNKDDARRIREHYVQNPDPSGLYNSYKLPFKMLAEMQAAHTSVGWASMDHTGDYVELAMFGPGSEQLGPFLKNTDLHQMLLAVAGVEARQYAPQWREKMALPDAAIE